MEKPVYVSSFEEWSEGQSVPICISNEALMPSIVMKSMTRRGRVPED